MEIISLAKLILIYMRNVFHNCGMQLFRAKSFHIPPYFIKKCERIAPCPKYHCWQQLATWDSPSFVLFLFLRMGGPGGPTWIFGGLSASYRSVGCTLGALLVKLWVHACCRDPHDHHWTFHCGDCRDYWPC